MTRRMEILSIKGIDTHKPLEFEKAIPYEGLIGRKTRSGGYYYLYEPQRSTSDLILLKKERKHYTQLGAFATDLIGHQNLKMSVVGSTIKGWKRGENPITATDTSFSYGAFGGVIRWERVGNVRIPVKQLKI